MTEPRDEERDDRHLKAVEEDASAPSKGTSDSSGSDIGRRSSSQGPPESPSGGAPSDASGDESWPESSDVESSEESSESESLRVVDDEDSDAEAPEDLDPVTRERDELREMLQRVQAEFENFRKRTMRDQSAQLERATERLVEQLLPVLDSFELAVLNVAEGDLDDAAARLRKGVELVYAELLDVLEKVGLERIEADGMPFDPEEHEAVMRDGDGDVITEVMRTGYRLKGRVLRPAMVKVGGPEEAES